MNKLLLFALAITALATSCSKDNGTDGASTCTTVMRGYNGVFDSSYTSCTFGVVNQATASVSSVATFLSSPYNNQGVYNTTNNSYYAFKYHNSGIAPALIRVDGSGVCVPLVHATSTLSAYEGLIYNGDNNKLYCIRINDSLTESIVEISTTGAAFSDARVASTGTQHRSNTTVSSTVDNHTGDMYFALHDAAAGTYAIEKYRPGSSTASIVLTGTAGRILGLRFNKNDNMLYGVLKTSTSTTYDFVKITPTGTLTTIAALPFLVNDEFYSATIDACTNRYVLATSNMPVSPTGSLYHISMTGSILLHNTTVGILQGLVAVSY